MRRLSLILAVFAPSAALAELPVPTYPECGLGGECPTDFSPAGDWNLASTIPEDNQGNIPADQAVLGSGLWADRAWNLTTGRTDVLIAVLDSGIEWDNSNTLRKHYIHVPELTGLTGPAGEPDWGLPRLADGQTAESFDANGDGVVNIVDWAEDPRLSTDLGDTNEAPDAVLDPGDLIAFFSDGVDQDGNGFIDDISGWDFFWNDNDPYDDTRFGHGTGEARWSAAEANDGGAIGVCPNCMVLDLRVGDSFVADGSNFGNGVLYAVDNGASVVQEALGTINNSGLVVEAIDYAWDHGVTVLGSAADETAYHQNYPGANHHTVYIHALRYDSNDREDAHTFLAYSNCSNHGPRLDLSGPSTSCSSGSVGLGAGVAGLMHSMVRDQIDAGLLTTPLTGDESYQLLTTTADDVQHNPAGQYAEEYPSYPGWDSFFGYGRINAYTVVQRVADGRIPPEADILSPAWFQTFNLAEGSSLPIEGYVAANRSSAYSWELQVAPGHDPRDADYETIESGDGSEPLEGVLTTLDLRSLPMDPAAVMEALTPQDDNVTKEAKAFVHAVTLRLRVTDAEGNKAEMRKQINVQDDPQLMPGMPKRAGTSIDQSPNIADVDGDGIDDLVFANSDGEVFVTDATLTPKPGWPVRLMLLDEVDPAHPDNHLASPAFSAGGVSLEHGHSVNASPAIGDLDGDGDMEVVVATLNGQIGAWHHDGSVVEGWPFQPDLSLVWGLTDPHNVYDYGFFSSPALGDLDGDGHLEVVIGGMDGRVYALHHDASPVSGFPVELREDYETTEGVTSNGERIISSPALGDLDGDGELEIVIGTNQKTTGTYGLAYAIDSDGTVLPGWPLYLFGAYTNALPYVGEGVPGAPTLCDADGDGTLEIATHTIADSGKIFEPDGEVYANLARIAADFGPDSNTDEAAAAIIMINSGAWGDMDGDGTPDYTVGTVGFEYANGLLDDGARHDHDHLLSAWSLGNLEQAGSLLKAPFLEGFPQIMEDMQFFLSPAIADLDGDGRPEIINGSAGQVLHAFDANGAEPDGWAKPTGQWILGSPIVGDVDGDGYLDVWTVTRSGYVFGWRTTALAATSARLWPNFRHDPANTGNCHTPLRTYPPLPDEPATSCEGCESSVADGVAGWWAALLLALPVAALRRRR